MKHVERRHFWIRDLVESLEIAVPFVSTDAILADFFLRSPSQLPPARFFELRNKIMSIVN